MANIQKNVKKRGFRGVGTFLFGMLFGLIFTLALIFGVGYWAYTSLSIEKVESITNKEINIGNDSIKKLTIADVVKNVSGVVSNLDTYTIAQLESDFDIVIVGEGGYVPESLYGLDLTPLKNSTTSTLKDDINDIIGSASLDTFISYLGKTDEQLGMFATIINADVVYYYDSVSEKLYLEESFDTEVSFDYEVVDGKIKLNTNNYDIDEDNGEVAIPFRQIPIEQSFSNFDAVTDDLTLGEILDVEYESSTGIIKALHKTPISELPTKITTLKLYEVMDYTRTGDEGNYTYTDSDGQAVTNKILLALADSDVNSIEESITGLLATDLFDKDEPILALFNDEELAELTILELPDKLIPKINDSTIYQLADAGIIDMAPEDVPETIKDKTVVEVIELFNTETE